ncbi:MAG TPA: hypothetical protein VGN09_13485 [Vicinamibacteria bacterium]
MFCHHPAPLDAAFRCSVCGIIDVEAKRYTRPLKERRNWRDGGGGPGAGKFRANFRSGEDTGHAGRRPTHHASKSTRRKDLWAKPLKRGDEQVRFLLYNRQDRLTWRQWVIGTLREEHIFRFSRPRVAKVLGIAESLVRETDETVRELAADVAWYRWMMKFGTRASDFRPENFEDDEFGTAAEHAAACLTRWNRVRPRGPGRQKKGREAGPPRPWGEPEREMLWKLVEHAGFRAVEDIGAVSGIMWQHEGKTWDPAAYAGRHQEFVPAGRSLDDILNWTPVDEDGALTDEDQPEVEDVL